MQLKTDICISREQISQGKGFILSYKVREKSEKMNSVQ